MSRRKIHDADAELTVSNGQSASHSRRGIGKSASQHSSAPRSLRKHASLDRVLLFHESDDGGDLMRQRLSISYHLVDGRAADLAVPMELNGPERRVLALRFGSPGRVMTYGNVARLLGVSTFVVRRTEQEALRKLRHSALRGERADREEWDEV